MTVETEPLGTQAKFLESVVRFDGRKISTTYFNKNEEALARHNAQKIRRFIPYDSYCPRRQKELTVRNAFLRITNATTPGTWMLPQILRVAQEFILLGYPKRIIRRTLGLFTRKTGDPTWCDCIPAI